MRYLLVMCLIATLFIGGAAAGELKDSTAKASQLSGGTPVQASIAGGEPIGSMTQEFGMRRYVVGNVPKNPPVGLVGQSSKGVIGRPNARSRFFSSQRSSGFGRFTRFYPPGARFGARGGLKPEAPVRVNLTPVQPYGIPLATPTEAPIIPVPTPITTITAPTPIETVPAPTVTSGTGKGVTDLFIPSGWMGDYTDINYEPYEGTNPHSGSDCIRIAYSANGNMGKRWAGIYWLYPENNWGNLPDGVDLTGYTRLTFWARGKLGGEKAEFKVGGVEGRYPDSLSLQTTGVVTLSNEWQQHTIDLKGRDLSHVIGGFCWVTNADLNPSGCTIYLDDIYFE